MSVAIDHRREGRRSKRTRILAAAIAQFGKNGYEHTRWASIADEVGIGQPALYHYFESKAHCLLTIMHMELVEVSRQFDSATVPPTKPHDALQAAVSSMLDASETQALQRRILLNHIDLLATERHSAKEEAERTRCVELSEEIETKWTTLIESGIKTGVFVDDHPKTLARLALTLVMSVWRWYRPSGTGDLDEIGATVTHTVLRLVSA